MGYQQKSYKKFVATAATATLVASAIVPVASAAGFSDVPADNEFATYINALVDQGIINGYASDNTFRPGNKLTRGQVAIMLGRWLENNGATVPADWATNSRFEDVSSSNEELAKYAALVKEAGVFTGVNGKLNPSQNITRENMAVVLDRVAEKVAGVSLVELAKEIEDVEVKDLNTAQAAYQAQIQALADLKITTVSNFRPKEQLTRAQFAKFLYTSIEIIEEAAAPTVAVESVSAVNGTVTVTLKEKAEKVDVKDFTVTQAINGGEATAVTPSKAELAEDGKTVTLTVDKVAQADAEQSVIYTVNKVAAKAFVVEASAPEVTSVEAINNKEILVTFSKEVTKETAETVANYTISNISSGSFTVTPKLAEDKKSVILTLDTAATQQVTADVKVANVTDDAGKKVTEVTKKVTFLDTTLPTATQVEVTGPKTLKVTFSEPMKTAPTFKLNGGAYSVTPSLSADGKSATLTLGAVLPNGEHTLEVSGGTDFSSATGFAILKQELKFNYATDTTAPTATIEKATETKVTLKFSKPVSVANLNVDVTAYHSINNSDNYKGTITAVDTENGYADTFEITFTTPIPAGTGKVLYLNTKENKFEDQWGNDVASTNFTFDVVSDTVAPTVTKVEVTGKDATAQKELTVTLSEEVVKADAENRVNYILKDAQGNIVKTADYAGVDSKGNLVGATLAYDKTKNQVKITLGTALKAGNYKLEIANIKDVSFAGNKMTVQTVDFTVTDTIAPTVADITHDATNRAIYVNFSEAMNNADLADESNYFLLVNSVSKELPTGSTVEVVSPQKVKITIPANATYPAASNPVKVQVKGNVKDAAGNAIGGLFGESTNDITWGTASTFNITPAVNQVKLVAKNQLQFELPTELSAIDSTKFTLANSDSLSVASATYVNNAGKSTVTVTLTGNITTTDLTSITSLDLAAGAVTNAEGLALTGTPSFAVASQQIQDKLAAEIVSVETTSANEITVTFSEAIPAGEIANASFTVAGNTVTSIAHTGGQKTAVITLKDAIETDETPAVSQVLDIKDVAGNVLAAGTKVVNTVDKIAPEAVSVTEDAEAKVITLTFSEALDATTVVQSSFTGTAGTPTVEYIAGSKTVKLTYGTALADGKTIIIGTAVKDAKGNAITETTFTRGAEAAGSGVYSK